MGNIAFGDELSDETPLSALLVPFSLRVLTCHAAPLSTLDSVESPSAILLALHRLLGQRNGLRRPKRQLRVLEKLGDRAARHWTGPPVIPEHKHFGRRSWSYGKLDRGRTLRTVGIIVWSWRWQSDALRSLFR